MNRRERQAKHKEIVAKRKSELKNESEKKDVKLSVSETVPPDHKPKVYRTVSDAVRAMSKRSLEQEVTNWRENDLATVIVNMQKTIAKLQQDNKELIAERDSLLVAIERVESGKTLNKLQAWKLEKAQNTLKAQ